LTDDHFKVPLQLTITPSKYFLRIFTFAGRPPFFPFSRQAAVFLSDLANPPLRPIIEAALLTVSILLLCPCYPTGGGLLLLTNHDSAWNISDADVLITSRAKVSAACTVPRSAEFFADASCSQQTDICIAILVYPDLARRIVEIVSQCNFLHFRTPFLLFALTYLSLTGNTIS
jgi:hypothetical protein